MQNIPQKTEEFALHFLVLPAVEVPTKYELELHTVIDAVGWTVLSLHWLPAFERSDGLGRCVGSHHA